MIPRITPNTTTTTCDIPEDNRTAYPPSKNTMTYWNTTMKQYIKQVADHVNIFKLQKYFITCFFQDFTVG